MKERSWAQIKYENLLEFYFACGKLGHLLKNCGEKTKMSVVDSSQMRYGPWLRAAPVRKNVGKEGGSGINGGDIGEKGYERNFWRERVELKEIRGEGYGGENGGGGGRKNNKEGDGIGGRELGMSEKGSYRLLEEDADGYKSVEEMDQNRVRAT